jgi:hypothetical protein
MPEYTLKLFYNEMPVEIITIDYGAYCYKVGDPKINFIEWKEVKVTHFITHDYLEVLGVRPDGEMAYDKVYFQSLHVVWKKEEKKNE